MGKCLRCSADIHDHIETSCGCQIPRTNMLINRGHGDIRGAFVFEPCCLQVFYKCPVCHAFFQIRGKRHLMHHVGREDKSLLYCGDCANHSRVRLNPPEPPAKSPAPFGRGVYSDEIFILCGAVCDMRGRLVSKVQRVIRQIHRNICAGFFGRHYHVADKCIGKRIACRVVGG